MSANTSIEWCDATVNWWAGCTAVSPACDNCYAKAMAGRLWGTEWGAGKPRHQFAGAADTLRALDRKAKRLGRPLRVFHNSLSDFFDNEVPVQWRIGAMRAIVDTPNLIHLLLTKRIGNAPEMLETAFRAVHVQREWWANNVPPNVWLGATVVNQAEADRDIPKLLEVPAAKRFLSMEPLLGPVDLRQIEGCGDCDPCIGGKPVSCAVGVVYTFPSVDWVIVGGESGPKERPMHPDSVRSLRDQCVAAGVSFLFKQWGEWLPAKDGHSITGKTLVLEGCAPFTRQPQWHGFDDGQYVARVGKKAAGRMLDGRTWDEVPT